MVRPSVQNCTVTNGSWMANANVTNVQATHTCAARLLVLPSLRLQRTNFVSDDRRHGLTPVLVTLQVNFGADVTVGTVSVGGPRVYPFR